MYLTLRINTPVQTEYDFDTLFNTAGLTISTQNIHHHNRTVCIEPPKQLPKHITYCKQRLKELVGLYPQIMTLTEAEIASLYTTYKIKKKTNGFRTINAPNEDLKLLQRTILNVLQTLNALPHDSAYAYIKGRSIYDAVSRHKQNNSRWFLKIDLQSFFDSCTKEFIYQQLIKIYPFQLLILDEDCDKIIKQLINIACLNGILPQGNPLAPYLTNLIMVPIDYALNTLAPVYTRYSDDMLFSARNKPHLNKTIKNIETILKDTPLKIKHEKTRLGSINGNNWNLGLMLNKDNCITVGHEKKRKYKAAIDQFLRNPQAYDTKEIQKLSGITAYYSHIEPGYFGHIINKYSKKHRKNLLELLYKPETLGW
jgi:RNA-directed DNA polymerase